MRANRPVGQGVKSDRVPTLFKKTLEPMGSQQVQRCGVDLQASVKCKLRRKAGVVNRGWRRRSSKSKVPGGSGNTDETEKCQGITHAGKTQHDGSLSNSGPPLWSG